MIKARIITIITIMGRHTRRHSVKPYLISYYKKNSIENINRNIIKITNILKLLQERYKRRHKLLATITIITMLRNRIYKINRRSKKYGNMMIIISMIT